MADPLRLDRASVVDAIGDYILQANADGYRPDPAKALAVRETDRTAWLRDAGAPIRREVYYFIEGELFPQAGATRLSGQSHVELANALVASIWDDLRLWSAYDFTPTSGGLDGVPAAENP